MGQIIKVRDYDIIYLSYDEPNAEKNYADLLTKVPWAKRIHGVEGSDAAHKACAELSETERFITIDGDNIVHAKFVEEELVFKDDVDLDKCVISWSGYNIVNGLTYGNGGIKCWPKQVVLDMKTHENADPENPQAQVDFCWDLEYLQINKVYSYVYNNATPWQAWRAGFREGVKMSLYEGEKISGTAKFEKTVHKKNLERLKIWQTVGADTENGLWAIYGAREGCYLTNCTDWDFVNVRDFEYLNELWKNKMNLLADTDPKEMLLEAIQALGITLKEQLELDIPIDPYEQEQSKFFKSMYTPPVRTGQDFLLENFEEKQLYDIVMITYDELEAEQNYNDLKTRFPRAKRVHGVKGIHQAHIEAAKMCTTEMIWIVDGDAKIVDDFHFDYISPDDEKDYVKVWRSKNPVNDLEYGYGGVKLFPRTLTLNMDTTKPDMTTSISRHFKPIQVVSNITAFNTDPFSTWRSAFRECAKLSSKVIDRQKTGETNERLETWTTMGHDRKFGEHAIRGARAGMEFGLSRGADLRLINDFDWLKEQFNENKTIEPSELLPIEKPQVTLDNDIIDLLDRFELLYQGKIEHVRRFYNDRDIGSVFKLDNNEELRKAVVEKNLHSIFRLVDCDDDLRKAVVEKNLHSIFRMVKCDDDLRKAVLEKNLHSIFRLSQCDDDLRKAVVEENLYSLRRLCPNLENVFKILENDIYSLYKVLEEYTGSPYVKALKTIAQENINFDKDSFSRGQIKSKLWLADNITGWNLGTVYICAGWYSTIVQLFKERSIQFDKIRSFDIDPDVWKIAEIFNKDLVLDNWKFKAQTKNILDIDYKRHVYETIKNNGQIEELKDAPDTIINTSCEHIENFEEWYAKIPQGKLVILQSNDYFDLPEHVNCVKDSLHFEQMAPLTKVKFAGELPLEKYTRYMRIGIK